MTWPAVLAVVAIAAVLVGYVVWCVQRMRSLRWPDLDDDA